LIVLMCFGNREKKDRFAERRKTASLKEERPLR
jgi:hypothetical protein